MAQPGPLEGREPSATYGTVPLAPPLEGRAASRGRLAFATLVTLGAAAALCARVSEADCGLGGKRSDAGIGRLHAPRRRP